MLATCDTADSRRQVLAKPALSGDELTTAAPPAENEKTAARQDEAR
jgi:hypothetical protein